MKMFRRKDEGFTLVELMVVVLIIGILVAIAIPVFNAAKANAQKKSCFANQRTIEGSAGMFQADAGVFPTAEVVDADSDLVEGVAAAASPSGEAIAPYLKSTPKCPAALATEYYSIDASGVVTTDGTAAAWATPTDHPYYK